MWSKVTRKQSHSKKKNTWTVVTTLIVASNFERYFFKVVSAYLPIRQDYVCPSQGVLKLYLLATPIFVFRNLTTLQDALRPSRFQNITKEGLIWELFSQIYSKFSISKFVDPFLEIGDPQKGCDPQFENHCPRLYYFYKIIDM